MKADKPYYRRLLTQRRALGIYILSFFLLLLFDVGRFADFLDRQDIHALNMTANFLQKLADVTGISQLASVEASILTDLTLRNSVGAISRPQEKKEAQDFQGTALPQTTDVTNTHQPIMAENMPSPRQMPETLEAADQQEKTAPETPTTPVSHNRQKILLIGDSFMMDSFGSALRSALRKLPDLEVVREARYSTGLSRTDYFDWPEFLKQLVEREDPDFIVICMGANDSQDIIDDNKKRHYADSASWKDIYRSRVERLLNIATSRGGRVIWIGLPIMGKKAYSERIRHLADIQKETCDKFPEQALFVDTWKTLADASGNYTTFMTDEKGQHVRLRHKDMIHVTEAGGRILTKYLMPFIEEQLPMGRFQQTVMPRDADNSRQKNGESSDGRETDASGTP